jgi:hypothetical protein
MYQIAFGKQRNSFTCTFLNAGEQIPYLQSEQPLL